MNQSPKIGLSYPALFLQWRKEKTGQSYEAIAYKAGLSLNTTWKTINGRVDPSASTLLKLFTAMGLDRKQALNPDLKKSQYRRAVVATAR